MPPRKLSSPEEFEQLLQDHDTYLFDCDGVIWHGMELISGVLQVLNMLRARGKQICFVTYGGPSRSCFLASTDV
jgi:4-nitrophenyl phosphatase